MPGDGDIASGLDAENEDHETSNLRDVLRRKLEENKKFERNKIKTI